MKQEEGGKEKKKGEEKKEIKLSKREEQLREAGGILKKRLEEARERGFIGDFEVKVVGDEEEKLPDPKGHNFSDAIGAAEDLIKRGRRSDEEVSIRGRDGKEWHITLGELARSSGEDKKVSKKFEEIRRDGGLVNFGGGPGRSPSDKKAQNVVANVAVEAAKKVEKEPEPKRRTRFVDVIVDCIRALKTIGEIGLVGAIGGSHIMRPERPEIGLLWGARDLLGKPLIGTGDKTKADWYIDNIKLRMQYAIIGPYLPPYGDTGDTWWEKVRKKRKKKKEMYSDIEQLLDIFYIDIEDVFGIGLGEGEIDLDYLQEEPSTKEYTVLIELMEEEGYMEEAEYLEKLKIGELEED